ncbi:MAG: hypothetical protein IJ600_08200 [Lachnospiraceae bacterium]|nr:hypothetical protein [Lachnospiraceae bacterium]
MEKFKAFGREITVSDEDMQWILDNDSFLNQYRCEYYLGVFFGDEWNKKNTLDKIRDKSDEYLSQAVAETAKKMIREEIEGRGTPFVRKEVLCKALREVYDAWRFTGREAGEEAYAGMSLYGRETVPFAEFLHAEEDVERLFQHYYVEHVREERYDDFFRSDRLELEDRCGLAEFNARRVVEGCWDDDFIHWEDWEEADEPGSKPLEDILRLDVMRSEYCAKKRLWIGGTKETVVIYFYGRDSQEYDKILTLKRRTGAEEDWNPESLWQQPEEPAHYHFHREGDAFFLENEDYRLTFAKPELEPDFVCEGFLDNIEKADFSYHLFVGEKGNNGEVYDETEYYMWGYEGYTLCGLVWLLRSMLYMPAGIPGTAVNSQVERWTETTRDYALVDREDHYGDIYTVTKWEWEKTETRFDILFSQRESRTEEEFEEGRECPESWYEQGGYRSFQICGLRRADVMELLKCLEAFLDFAWKKYTEEGLHQIFRIPFDKSKSMEIYGCAQELMEKKKGKYWKLTFRLWHSQYDDCFEDDLPWGEKETWQAVVVEKLKERGFLWDRAGEYINFEKPELSYAEVRELLGQLAEETWVRKYIRSIDLRNFSYRKDGGYERIFAEEKSAESAKNGAGDIDYEVPEELLARIPLYFYQAMMGELISVFGFEQGKYMMTAQNDTGKEGDEYFEMSAGSVGWADAFFMACKKLDMMWLWEYRNQLEWYESDVFDGKLEALTGEYFILGKAGKGESYSSCLKKMEKRENSIKTV